MSAWFWNRERQPTHFWERRDALLAGRQRRWKTGSRPAVERVRAQAAVQRRGKAQFKAANRLARALGAL